MSLAAFFLICCVCVFAGPARAGDDDDEAHFILFSGRDIWRNGAFTHGGVIYAPNGFDKDSLLLKVLTSGGVYRYFSGATGERIYGAENTVQFLPGFRVKRGDFEAKVFMGLDYETHWLWPSDPTNSLRGRSFGLRVAFDFWYEPAPTTMVAMDFSLATTSASPYLRIAAGKRVLDEQFYFGPEFSYYSNSDGYRHFRIGAHFTAMKTGEKEWTASGGWARDTDRQSSPYVRLTMMQRM
jgi:hypothetical protein